MRSATCAAGAPPRPTPPRLASGTHGSGPATKPSRASCGRSSRPTGTCGPALTDTLRLIAYRAETAMAAAVAPEPGNPDTVRSLLKALIQTDASLPPDPAAGTLTVRLLHQATRARDAALAPLLDELNQTRTVFPGTNLRLVYEILPAGPPPPPAPPRRPPPLSADSLCNLDETV